MYDGYPYFEFRVELRIEGLISLFRHRCETDFRSPGESHDFWEFIYVDSGKTVITAGEKLYVLKAGELAFHKPGEFHAVRAHESGPAVFVVAAFACPSTAMAFFEHRIMNLNRRERDLLYEALRGWKQLLTAEQTGVDITQRLRDPAKHPFAGGQSVRLCLESLLIGLIRRGEGEEIRRRAESYAMQNANRRLTENVLNYLRAHLTENVTLSRLATDLGYSVPQIKKRFREQTGCGVIDRFIDLKMAEAKRLLREGNLNVSQTAAALGYSDASYFTRLFKARFGMTPTRYCRGTLLENDEDGA